MYKQKLALNCFLHLRFDFLNYRKYNFNEPLLDHTHKTNFKGNPKVLEKYDFHIPMKLNKPVQELSIEDAGA